MRVVFHNPHSNFVIGRTLLDFLLRIRSYKKYSYLLEYLQVEGKQFAIYVDGHDSSLPKWLPRIFPIRAELFIWMLLNGLNPLKTTVLWNIEDLKNDDIFISFSLRNLDQEYHGLDNINDKKFLKLFHITHFVQNTSLIAKNIRRLNIDFLIAENNLSKNSEYFKKYFTFYKKDVYYLPFVYQSRFTRQVNFDKRLNKCLATGTIVDIRETGNPYEFKDFSTFYKTSVLQPKRAMVHKYKYRLHKYIDSYIGVLYENKLIINRKNFLLKIIGKLNNALISTRRNYFKFDIVEKYNSYKMFINGEEINDLPGIGMVEGMACGCVYIGQKLSMYKDLGMKSGKHYISYNGTLKDLIRKIKYYQKHNAKLELIAENGYNLITKKCNKYSAAKLFFADIEKLSSDYRKVRFNKKKIKLRCSFAE